MLVHEEEQDFAVHHIMAFYDIVLDFEALKNPFLMKFLMEVMIQQMPFGFLLSRLPKKMPRWGL